jgi:hypothetical protein
MTSIDDLKHDLKNVSDSVIRDLDTDERIRLFAQAAAAGEDDQIQQLLDTAPRSEYTAADLEYLDGMKKLTVLSLQAKCELQTLYQGISELETVRDKYMALQLLNESLSRLSPGAFEIDEFGQFDAPGHGDAEYAYGEQSAPDTAFLATKYRELWADVPAELLDVGDRSGTTEVFSGLAVVGLAGYPSDLSAGAFDDVDHDRQPSVVYETEVRLLTAVADFYTRFHGWRLFAEEHLGICLDEFFDIPTADGEDPPGYTHGITEITEERGVSVLSRKRDYLEAYPALLEEWAGDMGEDPDALLVDLDERAHNYADRVAGVVDLSVAPAGGGA